ncbi:Lhr family helicase [Bifidobacterium simiarum]|uniref:Lhr family helicase n=1 Tax=Bifidobacterium simiarum TaxID=2045441 RepID=UPI003B8A6504
MWSLIARPEPGNDGEDAAAWAVATISSLLDRYGVIASPLLDLTNERREFSALYPVLRRMEESGALLRGMFVEGLGAAQFARRQTVDALRAVSDSPGSSVVVLDALDPANLAGSVMPWPVTRNMADVESEAGTRPIRREGAMLAMVDGEVVLYATPRSHHLLVFGMDAMTGAADGNDAEDRVRRACAELAHAMRRRYRTTQFLADVNGYPLTARGRVQQLLHTAGFVPSPQGMKLYP